MRERHLAFASMLLVLVTAVACDSGSRGAGSSGTASDSTDAVPTCIADALPRLTSLRSVPRCAPDSSSCRDACLAGDGASCLGSAYVAEKEKATEADATRLFRQACLLGDANGCTNYAATIWAGEHADDQMACARRIFAKACEANEHFACGMLGRVAFSEATRPEDFARAGRDLEASCQKLGGFPCRVLAKHLEAGDLGSYEPERIGDLLKRACERGDPDACGEPKTAAETFK